MPFARTIAFKAKLEEDARQKRKAAPVSCFASKRRAAEWQAQYEKAKLHGSGRWQVAYNLCVYARGMRDRKCFVNYEAFLAWWEWRLVRHGFEQPSEVKRLLFYAIYSPIELRRDLWRPGYVCEWCGERVTAGQAGNNQWVEIDHRIPISKGGSNAIGNLSLMHKSCNRAKGAKI